MIADQLLAEPVHVVGHSYGAIIGALAAARKPEMVRSLTLIEPPATRVASGNPVVDRWAEETNALFSDPAGDLREVLARFFGSPAFIERFPIHCQSRWNAAQGP